MTTEEAKQKYLELHAIAGDRMMDEYSEDYLDWLDDTEIVTACETERVLLGNEICLCGKHNDPDFEKVN